MSRSGDCVVEFGGEERAFRLGYGQWKKVQEKCDAGPPELLARLAPAFAAAKQGLNIEQIVGLGYLGTWRVDDVREVILQGLLGANVDVSTATKLVRDWIDDHDRGLLEGVAVAYRIVRDSIIGVEDERAVGEPQAAEEDSLNSRAAKSDLEKMASTPSEPPADSPLATSMR